MAVAGTTTTTSFTEAVYTTILSNDILRELRPASVMRSFLKKGVAGDSKSYDFLLIDSNTSNSPSLLYSNTETGVGEDGTAFTVRELQTDKARATAGPVGIMGAVADVTKAVSHIDVRSELTAALGRTLKHKWEVDATANFASLTNSTTAAAAQFTAEDFLNAIAALEQRDVTGLIVGVFHPKQLADLRLDITGRTGEVWGKAGNDLQGHYRDDWGSLFDVPMYATTVVASSAGNYQGALFTSQEALGYLEIIAPRVELWRDGRALLDYVVTNMMYGSVIISNTRAQQVLSSTS
jgi:hypothetical protein